MITAIDENSKAIYVRCAPDMNANTMDGTKNRKCVSISNILRVSPSFGIAAATIDVAKIMITAEKAE